MTLDDPAPGNQVWGLTWFARLGNFPAYHHDPHILALMGDLHGEISNASCPVHTGHGPDRAFSILVQAGGFGIGS